MLITIARAKGSATWTILKGPEAPRIEHRKVWNRYKQRQYDSTYAEVVQYCTPLRRRNLGGASR